MTMTYRRSECFPQAVAAQNNEEVIFGNAEMTELRCADDTSILDSGVTK